MRRAGQKLSPLLAVLCVWLAPPDARPAVIVGRIIHPGRPEAVSDLPVQLIGVVRGKTPVELGTRSDAQGRFRFEGLEGNSAYFVSADYDGVRFPGGRATFESNSPNESRNLTFHIYDRSPDPTRIELEGLRLMIEREAGVYRVRHMVTTRNPDMQVVVLEDGEPAPFRIPLPAGHGAVTTPFGPLPPGVAIAGDALQLHGPFFPGRSDQTFQYELGSGTHALRTTLPIAHPVEQLEVFVRDFGVAVEARTLHPAQPFRDGDQFYLRYVGFDLSPGAEVPIEVEPLPPRRPLPQGAQMLLLAALSGGLLFLIAQPVAGRAEAGAAPAESEAEAEEETPEREALFAALRDLEHDFETGKLSAEDRNRLRAELQRAAVRELARERHLRREAAGATAEAAAPAEARHCECGRLAQPEDRFCAACGKRL